MDIVPLAADDLDEVEPIWSALREHHAEAGLSWIGPVRERADSWACRRADYARWLVEANDAAVRFYEREGFRPWARIMSAPLDP